MLGRGGVLVTVYHPALLRMKKKKKKTLICKPCQFYDVNTPTITDSQLPAWCNQRRSWKEVQTGVSRLQHTLSTLVQDCPKPEADVSVFLKIRILFYLFKNFFNFYFWMFCVCVAVHGVFSGCSERGPLCSCELASYCGGFSCGAQALQRSGFSSCGTGVGCPEACGIFLDQGSNSRPLHWQADSQLLDHQESPGVSFWYSFIQQTAIHWPPPIQVLGKQEKSKDFQAYGI